MNKFLDGIIIVATAIVGVAIIAVLVGKNSQTVGVVKAATEGFARDLAAAVSPVTGASGFTGTF